MGKVLLLKIRRKQVCEMACYDRLIRMSLQTTNPVVALFALMRTLMLPKKFAMNQESGGHAKKRQNCVNCNHAKRNFRTSDL